ncbi:MAG: glycosyltransferase family 1 protein [Rhodobacteraceae bacterium]|nr:glycosyltransferase family 1 protein [Paracoccaceae bacterium]
MQSIKDLSVEILDTNSFHWNFEPFGIDDGNKLAVGFNSLLQDNFDEFRTSEHTKIALFNNWAPCEYAQGEIAKGLDALNAENKFNYILTICPYSAHWRNSNSTRKRFIYAFYPYSTDIIPAKLEKKYDAIYHGGIHGKEHIMAMKTIMKRNYRYSSLDYGINKLTSKYLKHATDINLPFKEKIERIAETKISICFNLIHVSTKHLTNMRHYRQKLPESGDFFDGLRYRDIISNYPWVGVLPQFKTRVHEAAIARSVNLVYRDSWNLIEHYYEPEKEFIYFTDEDDLNRKIDFILENWDTDQIQNIVQSAFEKAKRYTSENFMNLYSKVIASEKPEEEPTFNQAEFWDL